MPTDEPIITKAETWAQRMMRERTIESAPRPYVDPKAIGEVPKTKPSYELTFFEKLRLMPYIFQLTKGLLMKDAKTTVTALVGAAAYVLNSLFGIGIPQDAIIAVTVFVLGLFAGDTKKD